MKANSELMSNLTSSSKQHDCDCLYALEKNINGFLTHFEKSRDRLILYYRKDSAERRLKEMNTFIKNIKDQNQTLKDLKQFSQIRKQNNLYQPNMNSRWLTLNYPSSNDKSMQYEDIIVSNRKVGPGMIISIFENRSPRTIIIISVLLSNISKDEKVLVTIIQIASIRHYKPKH